MGSSTRTAHLLYAQEITTDKYGRQIRACLLSGFRCKVASLGRMPCISRTLDVAMCCCGVQEKGSNSVCSSEHSHQMWLTETRLLVLWKLPSAAEELQRACFERASAFPPSNGADSITEALREAQTVGDLFLIPTVSPQQQNFQKSFLRANFKPSKGVVEVRHPAARNPLGSKHKCTLDSPFVPFKPCCRHQLVHPADA